MYPTLIAVCWLTTPLPYAMWLRTFMDDTFFELKNILKEQSPVHIVHLANALANLMLTSLRSLPEKDFETLSAIFR